MIWKVIGQSVIGSSHTQAGKGCEDAINYQTVALNKGGEALICFVSDGAGSAKHAATAAATAVELGVALVNQQILKGVVPDHGSFLQVAERIYDELKGFAEYFNEPLNEFSCTLLGFVIFPQTACFLQIGDGAMVRNDGNGFFTHLWWPHNGEYQNTTAFLIDDPNFSNLKVKVINESIVEVAVFTDGLQMLALNNETETVHQPFFNDLFKWLRKATLDGHIDILNRKLFDYLNGDTINRRTDDDKTLFLATRVNHESGKL